MLYYILQTPHHKHQLLSTPLLFVPLSTYIFSNLEAAAVIKIWYMHTMCVCVCVCVWVCVCACVCALANFLTAMNYKGNINACRKTANDKGITWSNDGVELDAKTSITTSSIFPLTPNEQTPSIAEKLTLFRRATVI